MMALAEYNRSPYDINKQKLTLGELFERWAARAAEHERLSVSAIANLRCAYKHCEILHTMAYSALRAHMMQGCIDACPTGYGTKSWIKNLFYHLDKYALELDITNKPYSNLLVVPSAAPRERRVFTGAEVAKLWDNAEEPWVDTVLIYLYTGWRFSELLEMRLSDISLIGRTMSGGVKTKAGKGRIVPIHSSIYPLVEARYKSAGTYLFEHNRKAMTEAQYRRRWAFVMRMIGANHTIHETRHTFRSWLDRAGANIACVNKIMGHRCSDIGLQTYTHKTVEELRAAIELVKLEHTTQTLFVSYG